MNAVKSEVATVNKPCNCDLCKRHQRVKRVAATGTRAEMRALILELENALGNIEADYNVDEAILDGSWPSAREYAERIMAKTAPVAAGDRKGM